jgi:hypothetical protein
MEELTNQSPIAVWMFNCHLKVVYAKEEKSIAKTNSANPAQLTNTFWKIHKTQDSLLKAALIVR